MRSPAYHAVIAFPCAALGIRVAGEALAAIDFLPRGTTPVQATDPLAREVARQLRAYLADARFAFALPLSPAGTAFQRRVWAAIAAIPPGATRSYADLAAALGSGARAVGGACGANPLPLVVPCHRVVARRGLGGFSGGRDADALAVKRWLLEHERG